MMARVRTIYSAWSVVALVVFLVALLSPSSNAEAEAPLTAPTEVLVLDSKPVLQWTPHDVEVWMNTTIGYPEYSGYVRKHLIDGVTLLEMQPADFETHLPIESPLHVIKIQAHVKMLQGLCSCRADQVDDVAAPHELWSYMKQHPVRAWVGGVTSMFFPRIAMVGVYLFDHDFYMTIVGRELTQVEMIKAAEGVSSLEEDPPRTRVVHFGKAALYWIACVIAPDLYMAYQALMLTLGNYIFMPFLVVHYLFQAFNEYMLLYMIYCGTAYDSELGTWGRIRTIFSYTLLFPPASLVVAYVFPTFLQYVVVLGIVVHTLLSIVGLVFLLANGSINSAEDEEASKPEGEAVKAGDKKEADSIGSPDN